MIHKIKRQENQVPRQKIKSKIVAELDAVRVPNLMRQSAEFDAARSRIGRDLKGAEFDAARSRIGRDLNTLCSETRQTSSVRCSDTSMCARKRARHRVFDVLIPACALHGCVFS